MSSTDRLRTLEASIQNLQEECEEKVTKIAALEAELKEAKDKVLVGGSDGFVIQPLFGNEPAFAPKGFLGESTDSYSFPNSGWMPRLVTCSFGDFG